MSLDHQPGLPPKLPTVQEGKPQVLTTPHLQWAPQGGQPQQQQQQQQQQQPQLLQQPAQGWQQGPGGHGGPCGAPWHEAVALGLPEPGAQKPSITQMLQQCVGSASQQQQPMQQMMQHQHHMPMLQQQQQQKQPLLVHQQPQQLQPQAQAQGGLSQDGSSAFGSSEQKVASESFQSQASTGGSKAGPNIPVAEGAPGAAQHIEQRRKEASWERRGSTVKVCLG